MDCKVFHVEGVEYTNALFPVSVRALGTENIKKFLKTQSMLCSTFLHEQKTIVFNKLLTTIVPNSKEKCCHLEHLFADFILFLQY